MHLRETLLASCIVVFGGGVFACNKNIVFFRGPDVTKQGAGGAAADCSNQRDICGNFSQPLRELCKKNGGGDVCDTNRWNRQFFNDLVNTLREGHSERPYEGNPTAAKYPMGSPLALNRSLPFAKVDDWPNEWNIFIADALDGPANFLLSSEATISDIGEVCPGYKSIDSSQKKIFWALFVASIAERESGKNPQSCYRESKFLGSGSNNPYFTKIWDSAKSKPTNTLSAWLTRCHEPRRSPDVYSEGLLQLSYGDEKWNPGCEISLAKNNIRDPRVNLQCGMIIMAGSVKKNHRVFLERGKAYWAVLFPGSSSKGGVIEHFKKYSSSFLSFCR